MPSIKPEPSQHDSLKAWWKESIVYQVYPSSFRDSNGDGIGDIQGVISKLDYIKTLGADIVWLNPIFSSPQVDVGYDISDYYGIHPPYGSVADVDELAAGLHARGMKLVLDLVVNHTSDQHHWFRESRSSRTNPYRDWYIWKKPVYKDGQRHPPNNWKSYFGGSAWTYDEGTEEYYLHLFAREQPDLNWETPQVRTAVLDIMRYWLDRGADGFRMDVINFVSKDQRFPDAPINNPDSQWQSGKKFYACGPRLHEYLRDIGQVLKEYDAFSVGEMPEVEDRTEVLRAVGHDRGELSMIFHFEIVSLDHGAEDKFAPRKWDLQELKSVVSKWQTYMIENHGWNAIYLENHDQGRSVSRFASDKPEHLQLSAKLLATFLGCQSGTLFIYQGQELGMPNVPKNWPMDNHRDIETLNHWNEMMASHPDDVSLHATVKEEYRLKSRDNARTPMLWDESPNAGFSVAQPWIPVNGDHLATINAAAQVRDLNSAFWYWVKVLSLRKQYPEIFVYGSFALVNPENEDIFAYTRTSLSSQQEGALIILNFRLHKVTWAVPEGLLSRQGWLVLSNYPSQERANLAETATITLGPLEALVWKWGSS